MNASSLLSGLILGSRRAVVSAVSPPLCKLLVPTCSFGTTSLGARQTGMTEPKAKVAKFSSQAELGNLVYETDKYVQEYLAYHFGQDKPEYMPYTDGPGKAADFNVRIADTCVSYLNTSPSPQRPLRALDVGCAVGRACFELARSHDEVVGIDFSQAFVDCCNALKESGKLPYERLDEGVNYSKHEAVVAEDIDRSKCTFQQGDACALPSGLGKFDTILLANLFCRLPTPEDCIKQLPDLMYEGGHVISTSPFSWFEEFTPKDKWFGGHDQKSSRDGLVKLMEENGFELVEEGSIPFLIREHARKYQLVFPHLGVWKYNGVSN